MLLQFLIVQRTILLLDFAQLPLTLFLLPLIEFLLELLLPLKELRVLYLVFL